MKNINHKKKSCLVAGASGLVGSALIKQLLKDDYYSQITCIGRKTMEYNDPRIQYLVVDFNHLASELSDIEVDTVFCCLGTTIDKAGSKERFHLVDVEYVVSLAAIMRSNGAQSFLLISSMGANEKSLIFYSREKGIAERKVTELQYASVIILRPSLLLGERGEHRFGEKIAQSIVPKLNLLFHGPLKKYQPVAAEVVALAMLEYAKKSPAGITILESDQIQKIGLADF